MEEKQMDEAIVDESEAVVDEVNEDEVELVNDEKETEETEQSNELEKMKAEKDALEDRLLRMQAEYDNYKRRTEKERIAERQYKSQDVITELLPVLDNFERALQTEVSEENQSFKDGVQMVYDQLNNALQAQGVEAIIATGEAFDPNLHHAVMQVSDEEYAANTVVEELQKGYMLKDKVIRPTMVKVNQ